MISKLDHFKIKLPSNAQLSLCGKKTSYFFLQFDEYCISKFRSPLYSATVDMECNADLVKIDNWQKSDSKVK